MDMSAYLTAPLQLNKICRACLTQKSDMKPLYSAHLDKMLSSFVVVQAQPDDGLPSLLCPQCVFQCIDAYTFKQQCEKSDQILREFTKPEFQAQLQSSATLFHSKIEVDDRCEVDQFAELAHDDPIKPELDTSADSRQNAKESGELAETPNGTISDKTDSNDPKLKPNTNPIEQADEDTLPLSVRLGALRAAKSRKGHKCSECDAIFKRKIELSVHLKTHLTERTHTCTVCSKSFAFKSHLKLHAVIHDNKNRHQCDQCDGTFSQKSGLTRHKGRMHNSESEKVVGKTHPCTQCEKTFKLRDSLMLHMRYHTGENLYKCNHCDKQYSQARRLKTHLLSHAGKRPFICETCEKACTTMQALKVHQRKHTGEKPHSCKICGMQFMWSKSLIIHMKFHSNPRLTHFCDDCGIGFSKADKLALHKKWHNREKAYECNVCGKKFGASSNLSTHKKSHLKEKQREERTSAMEEA